MSWISRLFALVAMAGALVATGAQAQVITPNPTTFTVAGSMTIEAAAGCDYVMTFDVPAGGASATVTNAAITGGYGCEQMSFTGLPWNVRLGPQKLYIDNFGMMFGPVHPTGSQTLEVNWGNGSPGGGFFYTQLSFLTTWSYFQVSSGTPIVIN
ncbi:hypothetical protein [Caulobacter endophyticus]|uniref:hypothetical protein n=1 Tax=Caulobacter endophyticus TaxID=2172652 RepID=UPI00241017FD|nr:hypothetical protein [Caulobacter endophyticus]MDG2529290.1 hypothetical protein [Caulobacter endophyticus]